MMKTQAETPQSILHSDAVTAGTSAPFPKGELASRTTDDVLDERAKVEEEIATIQQEINRVYAAYERSLRSQDISQQYELLQSYTRLQKQIANLQERLTALDAEFTLIDSGQAILGEPAIVAVETRASTNPATRFNSSSLPPGLAAIRETFLATETKKKKRKGKKARGHAPASARHDASTDLPIRSSRLAASDFRELADEDLDD